MKLVHLSDLHIGKNVNGYAMLEDQKAIFTQILTIIQEEAPEAVLLCGDIYDKTTPSAEAMALFDWFLTELAGDGRTVLLISGNHDSAERFDGRGPADGKKPGVYGPGVYGRFAANHAARPVWPGHLYALPFLRPAVVRAAWRTKRWKAPVMPCGWRFPTARRMSRGGGRCFYATSLCRGFFCDSEEKHIGGLEAVGNRFVSAV